MYGTITPNIVRVAEQTVVNLKELETRIELLKNDLAALCVQVGHPEAARLAATPVQWLGSTNLSALGAAGSFGAFNPMQSVSPFGASAFGAGPFSPFSQSAFGFGISPFATPTANFASPFGISPFALSPFAAYGAYPGSPVTQATSPFNQGTPLIIR